MLDMILNWLGSNAYYIALAIGAWWLLKRAFGPVARLIYLAVIVGIFVLVAIMVLPFVNFSAIFTNTIGFIKLMLILLAVIIGGFFLIGGLSKSAGQRYRDQRVMDYLKSLWKNSQSHWWDNN